MDTRGWYERFADVEARGSSATYEALALAVAGDPALIERLDDLPKSKRQPNLLFAAVRFLGGPTARAGDFLAFVHDRWSHVSELMQQRSTQTNEAARCSALLPVIAGIDDPIALIEVGASAGLCLFPDRYSYSFNDVSVGPPSSLHIDVQCTGPVPVPGRWPSIEWRAGIDLNPLDVGRVDDVAWLDACIWPEHEHRRERLRRAVEIAADEPPHITPGDLNAKIGETIESAPADATVVVWHSAVLAYLTDDERALFADAMKQRADVMWVSNEGPGVVPGLATTTALPASNAFLLGVGGTDVLAFTDPHGGWLHWVYPS